MSRALSVQRTAHAAVAAMAIALHASNAACPPGVTAPDVTTVVVSTSNPERVAWIVSPDCTYTISTLHNGWGFGDPDYPEFTPSYPDMDFAASSPDDFEFPPTPNIDRIASIPTASARLEIFDSPLSRGADLSGAVNLVSVSIRDFDGSLINDLQLPSTLESLILSDSQVSSIEKLVLPDSLSSLTLSNMGIASLMSLPRSLDSLDLEFNIFTSIDFPIPPQLTRMELDNNPISKLENITFPDTLNYFSCYQCKITSLRGVKWPRGLFHLCVLLSVVVVGCSGTKPLSDCLTKPGRSRLRWLNTDPCMCTTIGYNPITKLENVTFPDSLSFFSCYQCKIKTIRGVQWSSGLESLGLQGNPVVEFELRQSDYEVLSELEYINLATTLVTCTDDEATVKLMHDQQVCVISDERFYALYGGTAPTTPPSIGTNDSDIGSMSGSRNGGAASNEVGDSIGDRTRSATGSNGGGGAAAGSDGLPSSGQYSPTKNNGQISPRGTNGGGDTKETPVDTSSSSLSSTDVGIIVSVGSVFGILFAIVGYRRFRGSRNESKKKSESGDGTMMLVDTPLFESSQDPFASSDGSLQEYLSNDIRNDKALIPFRLDEDEIRLSKQIARGGFGAIYQGTYNGRAVAVKQMLPDAWRSESHLISFMDEIRLCASLSHPKIVEFFGFAWTSLRDITVVIEFMDGGDLGAVLLKHATSSSSSQSSFESSPREWSEPWTAAAINSKTRIAKDVAEAIVYLHSFSNPIIHRDLKARNVLLDSHGNAKLSDFGISRELAVDETMTSEVGTSAWIAPEVLRGDRYSERADTYSFGVLLVELDTCHHPFAGEGTLTPSDGGSVRLPVVPGQEQTLGIPLNLTTLQSTQHQNMKIAMLVSAGHLRPKPSTTCPARVQALITRCLSFAPENRPCAMEVHYELRQLLADM